MQGAEAKRKHPPGQRVLVFFGSALAGGIELADQTGLAAGGSIFVKEALGGGLVNLLDGQGDRCGAVVTGTGKSGLRLLDGGLEVGVQGLVPQGRGGNDLDALLYGLDVRHL